jgi:hypothetical protein
MARVILVCWFRFVLNVKHSTPSYSLKKKLNNFPLHNLSPQSAKIQLSFFLDCLTLEDEGITFLQTAGNHTPSDKTSYSRRRESSRTPLSEPHMSHTTISSFALYRIAHICSYAPSKFLLEKLIFVQLVKKFLAYYGSQMCITILT